MGLIGVFLLLLRVRSRENVVRVKVVISVVFILRIIIVYFFDDIIVIL